MSRSTRDVRNALGPIDPATEVGPPPAHIRRRILSTAAMSAAGAPPISLTRPVRRRYVLAAAAVAAAAVVLAASLLPWPGSKTATAGTPAPYRFTVDEPASRHLLELAERAQQLPTLEPARTWYLRSAGWAAQTNVKDQQSETALAQTVSEEWINRDGRVERTDRNGPSVALGEIPQIDVDAMPGLVEAEAREVDARLWSDVDPAVVASALRSIYRGAPEPYRSFGGARDAMLSQPLSGPQLSGVYRHLAAVDGIRYRGRVEDRAGRSGAAFSVTTDYHGLDSEYVIVVDARTGAFLGTEEVLIGDPGAFDVATPAVISYTVQLELTIVENPGDRPRQ